MTQSSGPYLDATRQIGGISPTIDRRNRRTLDARAAPISHACQPAGHFRCCLQCPVSSAQLHGETATIVGYSITTVESPPYRHPILPDRYPRARTADAHKTATAPLNPYSLHPVRIIFQTSRLPPEADSRNPVVTPRCLASNASDPARRPRRNRSAPLRWCECQTSASATYCTRHP